MTISEPNVTPAAPEKVEKNYNEVTAKRVGKHRNLEKENAIGPQKIYLKSKSRLNTFSSSRAKKK